MCADKRPNGKAQKGQIMKYTIASILLTLPLLFSCAGGQVTVGTGSGMAGVSARAGVTIQFGLHGDYLYNTNSKAYSNNKRGLSAFRDADYLAAKQIFQSTLDTYPNNSDATFYLGLTMIYLDEREQGFDLLASYEDSYSNRIKQEVLWWADYCRKKPEMTAEKIHHTMTRNRAQAYRETERFYYERRRDFWR
ncbi:conserved protein of unknown function [Pseudodesulfovibrio profundus]|uniref:Tetratricopeptide repeat protein n=2 Tax=Pseudodesulfovibrio profundus TaxID=57320 RepID=A0A2C8FEH0_9BACT|nr:conserved protein of unknown function [Pseudodesulfovibrio profundus]